jgi:hypothetical protein
MTPPFERQTRVFVLRVWCEYLHNDQSALRGELEDLSRRKKYPFHCIQSLEALVRSSCQVEEMIDESSGENQAQS